LPSVVLTCANCGNEESEGARFCGSCGAPFAPNDPPVAHADESTHDETLALTGADAPTDADPRPVRPGVSASDPAPPSPSVADDGEFARASLEASTFTEVPASASIDAPSAIAPPPPWPQAPRSDPVLSTPASKAPSAGARRRVSPPVLMAVLALLIAGGAVAALFGTGVIGGHSGKSESAFVRQVNENVLGPLGRADEAAAGNAMTAEGTFSRATDGGRIVGVADDSSVYLRGLSGLSARQEGEVQLLLALVAANRGYGQAFAAFTPENSDGELALDSAAAGVRAAIATAESRLSADLKLPSQTAIVTLRSAPTTPTTSTTNATPPVPGLAAVYVRQVDGLLQQSHAVVLALRSFVPRAASDAIDRSAAVTLARSYVEQRRLEVEQARTLTVPPAFAVAQQLLIRSLQASLADDRALVIWTAARRDGSRDTRAAFDRVNRLGARATALKQEFLRVYGPRRKAATGLTPGSLPHNF
jgi:hypothetical protein